MEEIELKIRTLGDPVLRKKVKAVAALTPRHKQLLSQMARMMYDSGGIGLAACQVGISEAMIVVDIGNGLYKLINPKIVKRKGSQSTEEGCLSVPGVSIKVKRAKEVVVEALNEESQPVAIEARDLFACVLQHEIDHLNGKLIVDYSSLLDRLKMKARKTTVEAGKKSAKL